MSRNQKLFQEAKNYLVGGVSSPVRSFHYVGGRPLLFEKGRGSKVYDYDGREYIDYVLSWGSLILGHAFPKVIAEVKQATVKGLSFGTTNQKEIELAGLIHKAIPSIERIRFVNSGSEAVMGAVRLARGYTKRDKIIKFAHSYHGHADYLLVSGGSGLSTLGIPQSRGVPEDFIKQTIVLPAADKSALDKAFKKYGRQIAAVIFEPVSANYGVVPPEISFLKYLRSITHKFGTLLIADEVITGFRLHFGSAALKFGIQPDLFCLGKIIGGGLPVGAYGGSEKIMRNLAPLGKVYQASTFSGNPIVMQAGLVTLRELEKHKRDYDSLNQLTEYLVSSLKPHVKVTAFASLFSLKFKNKQDFARFYRKMLKKGIYFAPSEFEANFLSFAHTRSDIEKTIAAVGGYFDGEY